MEDYPSSFSENNQGSQEFSSKFPKMQDQNISNEKNHILYFLIGGIMLVSLIIILTVAFFLFFDSSSQIISENELLNGMTFEVKTNDQKTFYLSEKRHTIIVDSVREDSVNLTIQSNPIQFNLKIGEEKKFDLNGNEFYDIKIELMDIKEGVPELFVQKINNNICNENWSCTEWSPEICHGNEIQTRTCTDLNSCGTNEEKPLENQSCTYVEQTIEISECTEDECFIEKMQNCIPATYHHVSFSDGFLGNSLSADLNLEVLQSCELEIIMNNMEIGPSTELIEDIGPGGEKYVWDEMYKSLNKNLKDLEGSRSICNIPNPDLDELENLDYLPFFILTDEGEHCSGDLIDFEFDLAEDPKQEKNAEIGDDCYINADCPSGSTCVNGICHSRISDLKGTAEVCCNPNSFVGNNEFEGNLCDYYELNDISWNDCPSERSRCNTFRFEDGLLGICVECSSDFHCDDQVCIKNECVERSVEICKNVAGSNCFVELAIQEKDITICDYIEMAGLTSIGSLDGQTVMVPFKDNCYYQFALAQEDESYCDYLKDSSKELCEQNFV